MSLKITDRYILWEIAVPCVLALGIISFLGIANELRERFELLPLAYVSLWDIFRLCLLFLPTLAVYVIPITYMLGILFAFGGLAQHGEIMAMRAIGIPLKRLVMPAILGGVVLSMGSFALHEQAGPWAAGRIQELIYREMPLRITFENLPAGTMHAYGDWRVYIGRKDADRSTLRQVEIITPDAQGRPIVFYAESAQLVREGPQTRIAMRNVHHIYPEERNLLTEGWSAQFELVIPEIRPRDEGQRRELMYLSELLSEHRVYEERARTARTDQARHELRKLREEIADRFSFPFACLAVSFAAAPLAIRAPRSGRSYSFAIGAGVFLVYFLIKFVGESRGLNPLAEAILRAELANVALCLAGLWFLWRVDRV